MPSTKEGLQRLLDFFVYGMLRASEMLGNAPLFLRTIEASSTAATAYFGATATPSTRRSGTSASIAASARCATTRAYRSIASAHSPWPRCSGSGWTPTSIGSSSASDGRVVSRSRARSGSEALETAKIQTYIDGLDDALGGGFPVGHVLLISGLPGTMKSSLSYAILHGNAHERGAKCLYVSLEQTRRSLEAQMAAMGFDVEAVRGDVHILDVATIQKEIGKSATKPWMEFLRRTLQTKKDIDGVDLVVIDSLEALEVLAKFEDRRTDLFRLFEWLRDLGATTVILADGVLELKMHSISDVEVQRRIRVVKMRGSHHKTGFSALVFEDGRFQVTSVISP